MMLQRWMDVDVESPSSFSFDIQSRPPLDVDCWTSVVAFSELQWYKCKNEHSQDIANSSKCCACCLLSIPFIEKSGPSLPQQYFRIFCFIHATRAFLPPHLSCIMNFVNELLLVWYIGSHRKKLWNQTLENFWENANLIFLMQKIDLFLQVLTLLFALVPYFWLFRYLD